MKTIRGKKALVTGAGSGIGRAIALALAREGVDLCLLGRNEARLEETAAAARGHGVEATILRCDLTQPAEISGAVKAVLAKWQRVDILVNNAGVTYYGPTAQMTAEQTRQILSTNLLAPIQLVQELLPTFLAQRDAHILNVSSMLGLITLRRYSIYQTTKFALIGFSKTLRAEYARDGIGVTVLCPPFVRTPMLDRLSVGPAGRKQPIPAWATTSPEAIATAAIRAIAKNKGLVVISWPARLLWWLTRLSPSLYDWLIRQGWRKPAR
jgi:3-oxoacyl-[acyl-carrier protein] reductase